jgi:hypothetical protein
VSLIAGLDELEKRNLSYTCWDLNPRPLSFDVSTVVATT